MKNDLKKWLDQHYITYTMRNDTVLIDGFGKCLIQSDYQHIFKVNGNGDVVFNTIEHYDFLKNDNINYIVFKFGRRWFYIDINDSETDFQFHILKNVGKKPKFKNLIEYYPLGIHTGYELLNGSGLLSQWCKRADFLGYKGIGIADLNTMAATLSLQKAATGMGLKYVFGYSFVLSIDGEKIDAKIYAMEQVGFRNMLQIQRLICVEHEDDKTLDIVELLNHSKGLVLVFGKNTGKWLSEFHDSLNDIVGMFGNDIFYQVDTTEYKADRIDTTVLENMKSYFDSYYLGNGEYKMGIEPILIQDVYYIDKEDWKTKKILNKVDIGASHEQSEMQYMKTIDELYEEFRALFSDKYGYDVFFQMCDNTAYIADGACASYDLSDNYMPEYIMTKEEAKKYANNHEMFRALVEKGFKKLVPDGMEEIYRERLEYEVYILEETDNIDYLLVQYDVINWCRKRGITTGVGRGSAGGSLVLFLLGITIIDPIKYKLIFERFLIPERAGLSPNRVTVIGEKKMNNSGFEIELENGRVYHISENSNVLVKRNGEEINVSPCDLMYDDDIIFDNRDLLFGLNENGENVSSSSISISLF